MSVPAAFDYHRATTVDEAVALLRQYGDEAKVLAGGHSLIPALKLRLSQPAHLIDIGRIPGLSFITEEPERVVVGALTTYTQIERSDLLHKYFPMMVECASVIADHQVRNRGTLGGSLAHADPASDMLGVVLALKAELVAQGPDGKRTIKADDFFVGTFATVLEPDEVLTELRFAILPASTGGAYEKLANKASHYAIAGCAAVVSLAGDGACAAASIAITGAAMQTVRAGAVEAALVGRKLDEATVIEAASHAADDLELVSDIHGSETYRRQMVAVVTRRAIMRALERV
ncbi:MAG: xanthine dehydrogenase family protein subunit M [Chloroflexi bacterium]|nr:MAG: xanthine dehydrogenase family protein subunit M [Chloroflexota bacterium]